MTRHEEVEPLTDADIMRLGLYDRAKYDLFRRLLARLDAFRFGSTLWICSQCQSNDHSNHNGPSSSYCTSLKTNVPYEQQCACRIIYLKPRPLTCTVIGVGPHGLVYDDVPLGWRYANGQQVTDRNTVRVRGLFSLRITGLPTTEEVQTIDPDCLQGLMNLTKQTALDNPDTFQRGQAALILDMLARHSRDDQ